MADWFHLTNANIFLLEITIVVIFGATYVNFITLIFSVPTMSMWVIATSLSSLSA
jgi:hypothetical protein